MPINELHQSEEGEIQRPDIPTYESPNSPIEPQLKAGLTQTHDGATRVVATGLGLRIVEPPMRPRYRQGV